MRTTVGQLLVNEVLPEKYRDYSRVMDKDAADDLLKRVAAEDPDLYSPISFDLMKLGAKASFEEGSTLRLSDLESPMERRKEVFSYVTDQENKIDRIKGLTDRQRDELKAELFRTAMDTIESETLSKGIQKDNPFAFQVRSKARGSKGQLSSLLTTPGTYANHKGETIPVFIRRSYAEGLRPEEYWSAAYGGRLGVMSTKTGTAKGGYLGKLLSTAGLETVVTEDDCSTSNGIPVKTDDVDNIGTVLAVKTGPFSAGTIVTGKVLSELKKKKIDEIVLRSPATCSTNNGVCSRCSGIRELGRFPEVGYHLGEVAASSVKEPVAQAALNTKHSGKKQVGTFSGFEVLKNMTQAPKNYPLRAAVASMDGRVTNIAKAPQGGINIYIDDVPHHALTGMDSIVKVGDRVEAGDILSDGIGNPAEIVRHKGIGEGRRYFAERFTKALRDSGIGTNRRNIEAISRSLVNHVEIGDETSQGDYLVGDTVSYAGWAKGYKPREGYSNTTPEKAVGRYLETPVMHYSIGTRITPSIAGRLSKHGYDKIDTHEKAVDVTPVFKSVVDTPQYFDDWMGRMSSSYLTKRLMTDTHRGAVSDIHGVNPIPGIAKYVEFGNPPPGSEGPW